MNIFIELLLGGVAGWLAGQVMKGAGYGIIIDIILGLVGGWVGGWIFSILGIYTTGIIGYLIVAFVGAVVLVWFSRLLKGSR